MNATGSSARTPMAAALAAALCWGASAQEAGDAADAARPAVEEIIVSAQKRDESIQEVPIAISAFTGEELRNTGIKDSQGLVKAVPGVSGGLSGNYMFITMRGINAGTYTAGSEPALGLYTDGIYRGRHGAAIGTYLDLDRVEVLKGPQGLLFGRNASSGAIHVITAQPDLAGTGASFTVGAGERGRRNLEGMVNVPLGDRWGLRVAALQKEEDGYMRNLTTGEDHLFYDVSAARLSLRHEPDWGDATLRVSYEDREQSGVIYIPINPDGSLAWGDELTTNGTTGDYDRVQMAATSLTVNVDLPGSMSLRSLTGFYSNKFDYQEDWDGSPVEFGNWMSQQESEYFSQEVVLSGDRGRLSWFAGASFYSEDILYDLHHLTGDIGWLFGLPFPLIFDERGLIDGDYQGWAVYGETRWQLTDALDLSVGGRYTSDERDGEVEFLGGGFIFGVYTPSPVSGGETWDDFSPRVALRYFVRDNVMLYGTASRGFKAGGFDTNRLSEHGDPLTLLPPPGAGIATYDAEEVWAYEVGAKGTLLDDRLRVAVAAFTYDYKDRQIDVFDPTAGLAAVLNVGEVEGSGVELELQWVLNRYWDVQLALGYLDAESRGIPAAACLDCDGNWPPWSPERTASGALNAHYPFGGGEWLGTLEFFWQSDFHSALNNHPFGKLDSSGTVNLQVGWQDERWRVVAYVENVADEITLQGRFWDADFPLAINATRPRTAGVNISYRFGM
ncbi:MAG: TonB-dependent receptor [Gammaproteobacteria bacterium]|nr:TonB-dependent receptor [Gammaproteobacteria bacterium]